MPEQDAKPPTSCPKCGGPAVTTDMPDHLGDMLGGVQAWTCPTCGGLFVSTGDAVRSIEEHRRQRLGAVDWGKEIERKAHEACMAATRGPWVATSIEGKRHGRCCHSVCRDVDPRGRGDDHQCLGEMEGTTEDEARANARFAAVARLALPSALCEIRRLRLVLDARTSQVSDLAHEARAIADSMREHRPMAMAEYPELLALLDEVAGLAPGRPVESDGPGHGPGPEGGK